MQKKLIALLFTISLTLSTPVAARGRQPNTTPSLPAHGITQGSIPAVPRFNPARDLGKLERRLLPFFQQRSARSDRFSSSTGPTQEELFLLSKQWDNLSAEFKTAYLAGTGIPSGFQYHITPGGHCEVYYTVTGPSAVDPADLYGYDPMNWRSRTAGPNGIPDYVDEVAWALDSSWSMEVDRFGFTPPRTIRGGSGSSRYKVVIALQSPADYGMTYPGAPVGGGTTGFTSYFELRNNWPAPNWQLSNADYSRNPELGIRVTCAHELFHGIQFAMGWSASGAEIDDFPLSWLEGTAVMMEELAFGDINDYIQYSTTFFQNPGRGLLNDAFNYSVRNYVYYHGLPALYLYRHAGSSPGIGFIHSVFENNRTRRIPFHDNLEAVSQSLGTTWPELLGRFHTAAYFTGERTRADTFFIDDARQLMQWDAPNDPFDATGTLTKGVDGYGMAAFTFKNDGLATDTLQIGFVGRNASTGVESPHGWSVGVILRPIDTTRPDSVIRMDGRILTVTTWGLFKEAIVVVTNGQGLSRRDAMVSFHACPVIHRRGEPVLYSFDIIDSARNFDVDRVTIGLMPTDDLRCALQLKPEAVDEARLRTGPKTFATQLGSLFEISFPSTWPASADSIILTIRMDPARFTHRTQTGTQPQAYSLHRFDAVTGYWQSLPTRIHTTSDLLWNAAIPGPGMYGLLASFIAPHPVAIYPNPVQRNGGRVKFDGKGILEVRIYDSGGKLVSRSGTAGTQVLSGWKQDEQSLLEWSVANQTGSTVVPGSYVALIVQKDPRKKGEIYTRRSILVLP